MANDGSVRVWVGQYGTYPIPAKFDEVKLIRNGSRLDRRFLFGPLERRFKQWIAAKEWCAKHGATPSV